MSKVICVSCNEKEYSKAVKKLITEKLYASGFDVTDELTDDAELLMCVGGDGALLRALHKYNFPATPIIGVNTGTLGFFQEIEPQCIDQFIDKYKDGKYTVQRLSTVRTLIKTLSGGEQYSQLMSLNEIVIKRMQSGAAHFNISIGDNHVQRFSGDGILICPPAGSTAYNYALGGSIIDPSVEVMQITPISPINSNAYRSFTSSIIVSPETEIYIEPELNSETSIMASADGLQYIYEKVIEIKVTMSEKKVHLLRFDDYDFWNKVKSKFL